MQKELWQARLGRWYWKALEWRYGAEKYIVMPHSGDEYNRYALDYLEIYLEREKAQTAVVLAFDQEVIARLTAYRGTHTVTAVKAKERSILCLLRYYALYPFTSKLTVISLTVPYDTCGENLLGVHGITKKELLCYDIYGFEEIPEPVDVWEKGT